MVVLFGARGGGANGFGGGIGGSDSLLLSVVFLNGLALVMDDGVGSVGGRN